MLTIKAYNQDRKKYKINFKQGSLDVGTSAIKNATVKAMASQASEIIYRESDLLCKNGIKNGKEIVSNLGDWAQKVKDAYEATGEKLKELIIFTSGRPRPVKTAKGKTYIVKRFSTLEQTNGEYPKNVNYAPLLKRFPDVKIEIFNDMIGAASAIARKVGFNEMPNKSLVMTTGGGCGTSYVEKTNIDGIPHLKISESRDGKRLLNKNGEDIAIESYGSSVKALIRNFCKDLGLDDIKTKEYIDSADARIVTSEKAEFIEGNNFSPEILNKASQKAIDKYAEGIAHCVKLKIVDDAEKLDQVFLSGRLIDGLNKFIEKNPQLWESKELSLEKLIKKHLTENAGKEYFDKIEDMKISIISDIKDNTEGSLFLEGKNYKTEKEEERGKRIISVYVPEK